MADAPRGHLLLEGMISRRRSRTKEVAFVPEAKPKEKKRPLRVARMLALAHQCEALIAAGAVADRTELAGVLGFTKARVTQLLDLTLLAPDIQEAILLAEVEPGCDAVTEHALRAVVRRADWAEQRAAWARSVPLGDAKPLAAAGVGRRLLPARSASIGLTQPYSGA